MQSHIGTHILVTASGEKMYKCPTCDQIYSSAKVLVEHIQNNHKRNEVEAGQINNSAPEKSIAKKSGEEEKGLLEDPISNRNKANIDVDPIINRNKANIDSDPIINRNKANIDSDPIINRNKANIDSDDDGSDTSADESDDDEEKPSKATKQSFSCSYCKDPKTAFTTR